MQGIAILGAGAAGMAAARHLSLAGHRPVVIAAAREVPSRGETLSPRARPFLESLGWASLLDAETAIAGQGRFSVWGSSTLRRADGAESHGFHLDRSLTEARIAASLHEAGIKRLTVDATALAHLPAGVGVTLADGGCIEVGAVVDCSGRAALSCGPASERRRLDRLVAAYRLLDLPEEAEIAAATLVEAVALGWWYMSPLPGRRMMVGLFTDSDLLPAGAARDGALWAGLAEQTVAIAGRLESLGLAAAAADAPPAIAPAASVTVSHVVEGRILRAGDAAAALDPLAANGLATALWSGIKSAEAALALLSGNASPAASYEQAFLEGVARHLSTQQAMYAAETRFSGAPFWERRSLTHPSSTANQG